MKKNKLLKYTGKLVFSAAVTASVSYCITNFLVKTAMDREVPKSLKKASSIISGTKKDEEFKKKIEEEGKKLESMPLDEIEIVAEDGTKLVGHWFENTKTDRIIIAMHGWRTKWSDSFGIVTNAWIKNNCSILYAEQRGQSQSGGDYIGFGTTERYDCLEWIKWVTEEFGDTIPIYLIGVSMGATTVLLASGMNLPDNVHGIIADCGYTSTDAEWKHITNNNLHMFYGIKGVIADNLFERKIEKENAFVSTTDAVSKTKLPILFIHGTDDHFVPVTMTYENYKACNGPKELLIIPGADHCMSYFVDKERYEKAVLDFWKKYDHYQRS